MLILGGGERGTEEMRSTELSVELFSLSHGDCCDVDCTS